MSGLLIRVISGWRLLRLRGRGLEKLITQVTALGFRLWRVERHRDELSALVSEGAYEALAELAQALNISVVTVRRGGLPFRWRQIRLRPFLLLGLATAWGMIIFATSHVWAVKVVAPNLSPKADTELVQAASQAGLRVGSSYNSLNLAAIRRRMLVQLPQYSWIGLHARGMVAVIDGIRFVRRPPDDLPARLVASHGGTVTAIAVYMGEPEVLAGERVKKGQVLISGVVTEIKAVQPKDAKKPEEESVVTPAKGEVMADVTYRVKRYQPYLDHEMVLTHRSVTERFLEFNRGPLVAIPSLHTLSYAHYTTQKNVWQMRLAGVDLPVRMIDLVYNERVRHTVRLSRRQAVQRGRERALEQVKKSVPRRSRRVSDTVRVAETKKGVWVTVTWVMNCNIATS